MRFKTRKKSIKYHRVTTFTTRHWSFQSIIDIGNEIVNTLEETSFGWCRNGFHIYDRLVLRASRTDRGLSHSFAEDCLHIRRPNLEEEFPDYGYWVFEVSRMTLQMTLLVIYPRCAYLASAVCLMICEYRWKKSNSFWSPQTNLQKRRRVPDFVHSLFFSCPCTPLMVNWS